MKTVICENNLLASRVAEHIRSTIESKADAVLALSAGNTMVGLWDALAQMCDAGELSFRSVRILLTAELMDTEKEHSCRHALEAGLLRRIDVSPENCFFPDPKDPGAFDQQIESLGGIDLAVLGIGQNGHIGYNEPGTLFESHTRVQKLTDRTKRQLLSRGFTPDIMPEQAVTMGIKTLTGAKNIAVIAAGEEKASAVFQMIYGKTVTYIPASFLQIPLNVTVYLDRAAASEL